MLQLENRCVYKIVTIFSIQITTVQVIDMHVSTNLNSSNGSLFIQIAFKTNKSQADFFSQL